VHVGENDIVQLAMAEAGINDTGYSDDDAVETLAFVDGITFSESKYALVTLYWITTDFLKNLLT
jgi:hypothetical protein